MSRKFSPWLRQPSGSGKTADHEWLRLGRIADFLGLGPPNSLPALVATDRDTTQCVAVVLADWLRALRLHAIGSAKNIVPINLAGWPWIREPTNASYRTDCSGAVRSDCWMLHEFLTSNRALLIDRCRLMVSGRSDPKTSEPELAHGIPIFLDQLINALTFEKTSHPKDKPITAHNARGEVVSVVGTTAALHGYDLFLEGFTIEQVVRDYGDVCQAVTKLAIETGVPISVEEFRTFNLCIDNAIAGAVTEYAKHTPTS
jgi:hypothetical protein